MNRRKVVPLLVIRGWCIVMNDHNTNKPIMYWDRIRENFNGLLTINAIFEKKNDAVAKYDELKNNPYANYKIVPVEDRYIDGDIKIKLKN